MKLDAIKYWRLTNQGYPKDTIEGEGDAKALALSIMQFWSRVTMGSRLVIEVYRDADSRDGKSSKDHDLDAITNELFAGLEGFN